MITFKAFITEMAAPSGVSRGTTYYHGTSTKKAGLSILKYAAAWAIDLTKISQLKQDGSNFFKVAEKIA